MSVIRSYRRHRTAEELLEAIRLFADDALGCVVTRCGYQLELDARADGPHCRLTIEDLDVGPIEWAPRPDGERPGL
jgi:hypothetical protein